jgi:hypothetical protein
VSANRWLAASQTNAVDIKALNTNRGKPIDFFKTQNFFAVKPRHAFFGHAICAAKVAPISD